MRTIEIAVAEGPMFCRLYGQDGPAVLILHGLFGCADNWHSFAGRLARRRRRVLVPDLRNHGRSFHSATFSYPAMAGDLEQILERAGLEPVSLIGHSMGAKLAMQFTLNHPAKVARLAVVDMAPRAYRPRHQRIFDALTHVAPATMPTRAAVDAALTAFLPAAVERQLLLKNLVRDVRDRLLWRLNVEALRQNYPTVLAELPATGTCTRPTLVIRGALSDYVDATDIGPLRELFPNAVVRTVAGAGHWVHVDEPDLFFELVTGFLDET